MSRLYLLRHAPAEERDASRWPDDRERPITRQGRRTMREMARAAARLDPRMSLVMTSPLARARQTARLLAMALGSAVPVRRHEALAPDRPPAEALALLRDAQGDRIVLVGHEPHLSTLASLLIDGSGRSAGLVLKKGGLCRIDFDGTPAPGAGRLVFLLTPRILRRLASI